MPTRVAVPDLFEMNRAWARGQTLRDPGYFERLAAQQAPDYLWIGCSDSRVPANEIVGLPPGEIFVHRNIANVVVHSDLNCLSVLQYAVEVLKVEHVVVCGHYGCGGVRASLENKKHGLIDNWLRHIQDVAHEHQGQLDAITDMDDKVARLCELNVVHQVVNVARTTVVQDAWSAGQKLTIHGWIYSIRDGLIRDLGMAVSAADEVAPRLEQCTRPATAPVALAIPSEDGAAAVPAGAAAAPSGKAAKA